MYKIVRTYLRTYAPNRYPIAPRIIETGLSQEAAEQHCADPESASATCTGYAARRHTKLHGQWIDGIEEE